MGNSICKKDESEFRDITEPAGWYRQPWIKINERNRSHVVQTGIFFFLYLWNELSLDDEFDSR